MKALYLDGRKGMEVMLDGPALRVQCVQRAGARYPLMRVSRVVTVGAVQWRLPALIACLRAGAPIAVLDNAGRFTRIRFHVPDPERGLARYIGELLQVPRYRKRYEDWFREAELTEMRDIAGRYGLRRHLDRDRLWAAIRTAQSLKRPMRLGAHYRYLRGLATAHAASMLSRIGLPSDPQVWSRCEYRFLTDIVSLEQWRHATLVSSAIERLAGHNDRRLLTAAFETMADERERRITGWRQRLLLEMMGVRLDDTDMSGCLRPDLKDRPISDMPEGLARFCHAADGRIAGNSARVPLAPRDSLRTGVKILRAYLEYDRRIHEPF